MFTDITFYIFANMLYNIHLIEIINFHLYKVILNSLLVHQSSAYVDTHSIKKIKQFISSYIHDYFLIQLAIYVMFTYITFFIFANMLYNIHLIKIINFHLYKVILNSLLVHQFIYNLYHYNDSHYPLILFYFNYHFTLLLLYQLCINFSVVSDFLIFIKEGRSIILKF